MSKPESYTYNFKFSNGHVVTVKNTDNLSEKMIELLNVPNIDGPTIDIILDKIEEGEERIKPE